MAHSTSGRDVALGHIGLSTANNCSASLIVLAAAVNRHIKTDTTSSCLDTLFCCQVMQRVVSIQQNLLDASANTISPDVLCSQNPEQAYLVHAL